MSKYCQSALTQSSMIEGRLSKAQQHEQQLRLFLSMMKRQEQQPMPTTDDTNHNHQQQQQLTFEQNAAIAKHWNWPLANRLKSSLAEQCGADLTKEQWQNYMFVDAQINATTQENTQTSTDVS
jgi:2-succinyl-5-enolpyruvyl-6-hydroxy-3-cyclohexene-1-carboxylate synthase